MGTVSGMHLHMSLVMMMLLHSVCVICNLFEHNGTSYAVYGEQLTEETKVNVN